LPLEKNTAANIATCTFVEITSRFGVDGNDFPQFVFGFGLSYRTFKYDRLTVTAPPSGHGDGSVTFEVRNTGKCEGDEVAQLYVRQTTASVATPVKALNGFSRVHLLPGESHHLTLHLKQSELAVWNANQEWKVEPGEYTVTAGGNSTAGLSAKFNLSK
jgi:beta-glucosidase